MVKQTFALDVWNSRSPFFVGFSAKFDQIHKVSSFFLISLAFDSVVIFLWRLFFTHASSSVDTDGIMK